MSRTLLWGFPCPGGAAWPPPRALLISSGTHSSFVAALEQGMELLGARVRRGVAGGPLGDLVMDPLEVRHLVLWHEGGGGVAVAVEAPAHGPPDWKTTGMVSMRPWQEKQLTPALRCTLCGKFRT